MHHWTALVSEDPCTWDVSQSINIYCPCGDPVFDTEWECGVDHVMDMFRSTAWNDSGSSPDHPRYQANLVTSWIDASMVYGSDQDTADSLRFLLLFLLESIWSQQDFQFKITNNMIRTFHSGLLNVTDTTAMSGFSGTGDLLPVDENGHFIAGDIRVNEQPGLVAMHTIFVRFHNLIAPVIAEQIRLKKDESNDHHKKESQNSKKKKNSGSDRKQKNKEDSIMDLDGMVTEMDIDELTYQHTKAIVAAVIQKITYNDWLPTLFGTDAVDIYFGEYEGYDEDESGAICAIFSGAAFRFGHSMLPQRIPLRDRHCNVVEEWPYDLSMADSFFQPALWMEDGDFMEWLVNGFACTLANEVDIKATESVRSFLFETVQVPHDLMALNIQRGRDHGLPDYNAVRTHLGLDACTSFEELSSDEQVCEFMEVLYKYDIDNIDLFYGLLAEDHIAGSSFGELMTKIVLEQFRKLRDSDRFWYENVFTEGPVRDFIADTTLADIVEMTTGSGSAMWSILDDEFNIFQNEGAISIFQGVGDGDDANQHRGLEFNFYFGNHSAPQTD